MKQQKRIVVLYLLFSGLTIFSGGGCSALKTSDIKPTMKSDIKLTMKKVADWQINNFKYSEADNLHDFGIDSWTNAVMYLGMFEWAKIADDSTYFQWLENICLKSDWNIPANFLDNRKYLFYHADELCIGQFYLNMFDLRQDKEMLSATMERVNEIMNNPPDSSMNKSNKQSWTWCDALFMAPPVYAHIAKIENDARYLKFMDGEFKKTYNFLYDKENKLFYRDSGYFDKKESNGKKIFWGRGNGWVAAGLVNILKLLPENSEYRPFYENLFKEFVPQLAAFQGKDGFWHASLLDPASYPAPETSASALIAYALAYGVNQGLLDKNEYVPVVEKSWAALFSAIDKNGKLGWVQPIGADPKKVTAKMVAPYGVGAFLLAGSEIYNFLKF